MELTEYRLGDLCEVTRGASLAGEYYATEGKYKRITLGNFNYKEGGFKDDTQKEDIYYIGKVDERFILRKGDILTPLTEQALGLLGSTIRIPENDKYIQSQDAALITCNEELLDPDFCYYLISSDMVRSQLSAAAQQTKIRHTSPDKIKACKVFIPKLAEQKKIGRFLRQIEEKIALNKQINRNLEALARQLYDYWFMQFDFPDENGKPYKSNGGKMVFIEQVNRYIPKDWEIKQIQDLCNVRRGASPRPIDDYMDETHKGIPWLKISDATVDDSPFVVNIKEHIISSGVSKSVEIEEGTLVVTNSANPGLPKFIYKHCCVHDGWLVLTEYEEQQKYYLYYSIEDMRIKLERMATGSIFKNLRTEYLQQYKLVVPPKGLLLRFTKTISPMLDNALRVAQETSVLIRQRDELLPLLMNGQVNSDLSAD